MNAKKVYLLIGVVFVMGLLPQGNVSADMGPKPTMDFEFVQEVPGSALTMVSWSLINCENNDCTTTGEIAPFEDGFRCADNHCGAGVHYGIQYEYFRMEISFSDGVTRKSNVFTRNYFDAKYRVVIQNDSLFVEELKGSNPSLISNPLALIFLSPLLIPIGCAITIVGYLILTVIGNQFITTDRECEATPSIRKPLSPLLWVAVILFVLLGLLLNIYAFVFTLAIEGFMSLVYLKYTKTPVKKIVYGVLLANVFTHPLFVMASTIFAYKMTTIIMLETIVWLVEAWIVNKVQGKQFPFKTILILTIILNAASFGIGLLLPI